MQTYKYNASTKEYLYAEAAFLDPLETKLQGKDVYLIPADSTTEAPLDPKDGHAVCWNGSAWEYIEDHRKQQDRHGSHPTGQGTPYWLEGDTYQSPARYMEALGPLPEGALLTQPEKPQDVIDAETLAQAKRERADAVSKITVEVDGLIFDGDETSQDRMSRTITAATTLGLPADTTIEWTLADTTSAQVTVMQLAQALLQAGQAQTAVWRTPYEA